MVNGGEARGNILMYDKMLMIINGVVYEDRMYNDIDFVFSMLSGSNIGFGGE